MLNRIIRFKEELKTFDCMYIKLLVLDRNTRKSLTESKEMSSGSFKDC